MPNQDKQKTIPSSQQPFHSHRLRAMCALILASSVGFVACQPAATHEAQTGPAVLMLTAGPSLVPSADTLLQTQKVLNLRLQREGFGANAVQLEGKSLKVTLPSMSAERLKEVKEQLLLRQGVVSLTPMLETTTTFTKLKPAAARRFGSDTIAFKQETWKGPAQEEHSTYSLRHPQKQTLSTFVAKLQKDPALAPAQGESWSLQEHKSGGWAAYLLAEGESLKLHQLKQVQVSFEGKATSVNLKLAPAFGKKLEKLTTRHLGKRLVIRVDRVVHAAPVVRAAIRGSALRLSMLSAGTTHPLIRLLGAGALPIELQIKMSS